LLFSFILCVTQTSGGTKGVQPVRACAPAVNHCATAVPRLASHRHFIMLCSTSFSHKIPCIILHTNANILTLMTPEDRILKAIFKKPCEVTPPTAFATRSYTQLQHMAVCRAQDAPSAWTQTIVPLKLVCPTCAPANSWLCHWLRHLKCDCNWLLPQCRKDKFDCMSGTEISRHTSFSVGSAGEWIKRWYNTPQRVG